MATIPTPEAGLVIGYSYLWRREHQAGQDEGVKDRPCVIILAVERNEDGATVVTVLAVTHSTPTGAGSAVEIPHGIKRHLGLDDRRSWIVVAEGNEFVWPGYDLRKVVRKDRYDYGFLPPKFFTRVLKAFVALNPAGERLTSRD